LTPLRAASVVYPSVFLLALALALVDRALSLHRQLMRPDSQRDTVAQPAFALSRNSRIGLLANPSLFMGFSSVGHLDAGMVRLQQLC